MTTRSVLFHLPGLPLDPVHLLPQRELGCAAGALLCAGHWTRVVDYGTVSAVGELGPSGLELDAVRRVAGLGPLDFVVFLVRSRGDYGAAVRAGRQIRDLRDAPRLLLAGPFASAWGDAALAAGDCFSGLLLGEAGGVLPLLAARLTAGRDLSGVPSLVYREGRRIRSTAPLPGLEEILLTPCYSREAYPALREEEKVLLFPVGSPGWGAPPLGASGPPGWQARRAAGFRARQVREEMAMVSGAFGGAAFHVGAGWAGDPVLQERVARELLEYGCVHPFSVEARPLRGLSESVALLRRAGCEVVGLDIRTGSQILHDDFHGTGYGVTTMEGSVAACRAAGVGVHASLAYPCAWDDWHTREETVRFLRRTQPDTASLACATGPRSFQVSPWRAARWLRDAAREVSAPGVAGLGMRGWTSSRVASEQGLLAEAMARHGVARCDAVETALMARLAGYVGSEGAYDAVYRQLLASGDGAGLRRLVGEFNASVAVPEAAGPAAGYKRPLEAVGN